MGGCADVSSCDRASTPASSRRSHELPSRDSGCERGMTAAGPKLSGHDPINDHHQPCPLRTSRRDAGGLPGPSRRARPDEHLLPRGPRRTAAFGYLAAAVPVEFGGAGLDLVEMAASQRRLARYAPATALAMTMHSYWIGIATELERAGDTSLRWILEAAVAGEVFAAGHAETGNDIPVLMSTCVPPSGCRAATGSPAASSSVRTGPPGPGWAPTPSTPTHPAARRSCTPSSSAPATASPSWRRGTRSGCGPPRATTPSSTQVFVPDERIGRVTPAGDGNDLFLVAMTMWPLSLMAAVYLGIADRSARTRGRRSATQDVGRHRARRLRLQPVRPAPGRRDVPRARRRLGDARTVRRRLGGRGRPRSRVGVEGVLDEVARRRGGQASRRRGARRRGVAPGCSAATNSSASTETCAAAASIRPTTRSPTRWSARRCSASSASSHGGELRRAVR
jgi:alkylation response protein AidB-like acyl-CoA dehydrogenase